MGRRQACENPHPAGTFRRGRPLAPAQDPDRYITPARYVPSSGRPAGSRNRPAESPVSPAGSTVQEEAGHCSCGPLFKNCKNVR